jgi:hypothetical protein
MNQVVKTLTTLFASAVLITTLSCTAVNDRRGLYFTSLPSSVTGIDFSQHDNGEMIH